MDSKTFNSLSEAYSAVYSDTVDETYTVTAADKKGNTPAYQAYKAGKKKKDGTPMYKAADHMGEEASMSQQELMLQKKKARIDRMIAMKRAQELSKTKAGGDTPAKAMGEGLSIDQQMKISQDYNRKSPEEKKAMNKKVMGIVKKVRQEKDTRTDAQKMTDATGPRPGSRYRGD
jgi:type IV secretory pathway TrbL component